jgi:very-short-patch-repair endonuclease
MKYQKGKARYLRKSQTFAEKIFWKLLKNRKFDNLKFRRQHPIDNYIVDFYCKEKSLIIEIDGPLNEDEEKKTKDMICQKYLESKHYRILRFKDTDITKDIDNIQTKILNFLDN